MIILLVNIIIGQPVEKDFYTEYYDVEEVGQPPVKLRRNSHEYNAAVPIKSQLAELPPDDSKLYDKNFATFNDASSTEVDVRQVIKRYYSNGFQTETEGYH